MTKNKRLCVAMPPELEERVYDLRKKDKYCRMTISEVMRQLIIRGLDCEEKSA